MLVVSKLDTIPFTEAGDLAFHVQLVTERYIFLCMLTCKIHCKSSRGQCRWLSYSHFSTGMSINLSANPKCLCRVEKLCFIKMTSRKFTLYSGLHAFTLCLFFFFLMIVGLQQETPCAFLILCILPGRTVHVFS